jgi:hypothetical protein
MRVSSVVGRVGTHLWMIGRKGVGWRRREAGRKPRQMYRNDRYESGSLVVKCVLSTPDPAPSGSGGLGTYPLGYSVHRLYMQSTR